MDRAYLDHLARELEGLKEQGLFKQERVIVSPQDAVIRSEGREVLNFCANNYLGLANHPRLIEAALEAIPKYGYGMASVRFICGTQDVHKELEARLSKFLGTEDTILYSSCFDANGGLFETLLGEKDAIVSDALNHASIIDGVRLSKAKRYRYANNDMNDLEAQLKQARADGAERILVATDGVFSMDGVIADLASLCDLADRYGAMTMVDDSHAVGFVGEKGRGTHELAGVMGRIDVITGTLGKALGGASGGYTSGRKEIVAWLRQRSRPYLFSNTLAPVIAKTTIACLDLLEEGDALRQRVRDNSARFREGMSKAGFTLAGAGHPIIPVMLGDAKVASDMAQRMMARGIYVIGFSFPVVPRGQARIRTQMSAAHEPAHVDRAVAAFTEIGREMGLVS
ncbi:MAG: glycine C-acetyltransferase [Deltaproteobacteria bacterium]|nr:glycine C-acetyltransferase [Deltaproteobacteria bacterium]